MKALNKGISKKTRIVILVLVLVVLALVYYRFVYIPVNDSISRAQNEQYSLQDQEMLVTTQYASVNSMSTEIEEMKKRSDVSQMPSYNSSKLEVAFLNNVLVSATDYDISFTAVTRNGDQIRRYFVLSFTTNSYADAEKIITELYNSDIRLLLGDISISAQAGTNGGSQQKVSLSAAFFETMVGGTPDAGLPADQ